MPDRSPARGARRALRAFPGVPRRDDRGAVTAEVVVALPVLVALAMGPVWLVALAVTQVRVVDAARETARAVARDEPTGTAVALGRRVAPEQAAIRVHEEPGAVRVRVVAEVRGPGGLFAFLPGVEVDAEAFAARESS